jgi:hypothetical protein
MSATVATKSSTDRPAWREVGLQNLREWLPAMRYCAAVYLVVRTALFLLAASAWGLTRVPHLPNANGRLLPLTNGWHNAFTVWDRFDATWFLYIAKTGYSNHNLSAAFYPGYPMLARLVGYVCVGNLLLAAYLVSNVALLAALVLLYRLTELEYDQATARRAVLYLAVFPTALFLFGLYSESLFLLAAVGAFYLARRGHWWWAGVVGIGAALTRNVGVFIVLALAVEAVHQTVEDHHREAPNAMARRHLTTTLATRLIASAVPLAGTGGYLLFWQLRYHDWSRPITAEKVWHRKLTPPWQTLWHGLTLAVSHAALGDNARWTFDFVFVAVGLALAVWVAVRTRPVYAVYTWSSILLFLSESATRRPLGSDPRYLVTIFPLVWALARLGRRPGWHDGILALSAVSLAIISWLFLTTRIVF